MRTLRGRFFRVVLTAVIAAYPAAQAAGQTPETSAGQSSVTSGTNPTGKFIYPSEGQTAERQQQDQLACYDWAVGQTAFDPVAAAQETRARQQEVQQQAQAQAPQGAPGKGAVIEGAAGGAAGGAVIGAVAGNAGTGAAIGAVSGGLIGGWHRRHAAKEQAKQAQQVQQQAQQQSTAIQGDYQSQVARWNRAYTVCLQGRGYTVD